MLVVTGLKRSQGTFSGNNYDNYYVYCMDSEGKDVLFGICSQPYKVKAEVLHQLVKPDQVKALEGKKVNFLYDTYKNVARVEIVQ